MELLLCSSGCHSKQFGLRIEKSQPVINCPGIAVQASVCIGSTSAKACRDAGLTDIYFPELPGLDTWVVCVEQAAAVLKAQAPAHKG